MIYNRALKLSRTYRKIEQQIIEILIQVEETKLYRILNKPSMFLYATELLNLSEAVAFSLISVAGKARAVPALREAIAEQKISTSKASRMVAFIGQNNANELIQFASCHTSQEIDFEVAKRNTRVKVRDKVKVISEDQVRLTLTVDKATLKALRRVQSLRAQKGKPATLSESLSALTQHYLNTQDPVRKAERAVKKDSV